MRELPAPQREDAEFGLDEVADLEVKVAPVVRDVEDSLGESIRVPTLQEQTRQHRIQKAGPVGPHL